MMTFETYTPPPVPKKKKTLMKQGIHFLDIKCVINTHTYVVLSLSQIFLFYSNHVVLFEVYFFKWHPP